LDSTEPRGINNAGEIVGVFSTGTSNHGFLYNGGAFTNIDVPGSPDTFATGINASGQIVGYDENGDGFLYSGGSYQTFDDPLGLSTLPQAINAAGQIVGAYATGSGAEGFLYSGGVFTTIDDPLGTGGTVAQSINAAGQIVGYYWDSNFNYHGFLYSDGNYVTLDDPSARSGAGWGTRAFGINDAGEIVGTYYDSSDVLHGFTAVDPPVTSTVIANGDTAEFGVGASPNVQFAGSTGTLQLDASQSFTGQISGFAGQDQIDLGDIACSDITTTLDYWMNSDNSGGTLTVSDGTHTANLALLGQYMASSFATASDGHGGTLITESNAIAQNLPTPHA